MRSGLIASLLFLSAAGAFGQTAAGLAAISGVVRDPSGVAVPDATVVISNGAQGTIRTLTTNTGGVFTAPALTPGSAYRVMVTAPGFATYEALDLDLQVGQNLNLSVNLTVSPNVKVVEVTLTGAAIQDTKTDVSQVIDSKFIQDLPINGRRVDSFVLLTPGVTNDSTFGLLTFRGVAGGNSFLIDGNDTTEQFYNENAGRTRIASQISQDAVQEFQVVSSNFSAEFGRAVGGVVNTVTRGGGNGLHGTAYWFFRNRTLNARDRFATINPDEVRHQAGFSLGGALIKDKLFYFINGDFTRRDFPIVSSIARAGVIDPSTQSFIGCGAPATPAQCAAINTILPRYYGLIPREANQELGFGRLDWRPSERNTFSASLNYLHFLSPNGIQTNISSTTGAAIGSNGDDSVRVRNGRASWTAVPKPNWVNELRLGWATDRQADTFDQAMFNPMLSFVGLTVAGQTGLGNGVGYLPRVEPNEQRFQIVDNASWTKGKHIVKFGFDIANTADYTYYLSPAYGLYTYQTVSQFALDFSGNPTGAKNWQSYSQAFGNPVVNATIRDYGFYAEDQFLITPKLTVTYGARYEYAQLPQPKIVNPDYPQTAHIPTGNLNLAPRVGVTYSLNEKTVVRAGFGVFHARFPASLIDNLFTNNGVFQTSVNLQGNNPAQLAAGPVFGNWLNAVPPGMAAGGANIQFAAPNLRTPYSEQGTIGVERLISRDVSITASYIWSRGVQLLAMRDLNMGIPGPDVTYTINDAGGNTVGAFATPVYLAANRVDPRYGRVIQDENGIKSFYNALAVQVNKRFSHGFQALASYTWAHSIDDGQGAATDALYFASPTLTTYNGNYAFDKGSSGLDQRHRMVLSFVEEPTFTHRDGAFFKYVVNNWQLGAITTLASGRPTTAQIRTTDTAVPGMAYTNSIDGFGGSFRVPFWPVNSLYTPPTYRADARIAKVIPITERARLYLTFEVFNLSNTTVDTSINNQAYSEAKRILTLTPGAFGVGTASAGFPDGTNARRAQLGVRCLF
ncbi:MAG TPA: carboxypeptidase regulatory-like domain-containing protein [Candidatus Acidoferrales bacterium]|nr:carboxypeptidase regulatory-like domain-containing protein [Candidatus Acidoferrales bacterium]